MKSIVAIAAVLLAVSSVFGQTKVNPGEWSVRSVRPADVEGQVTFRLQIRSGIADLYVRRGAPPTKTEFDVRVPSPGAFGARTSQQVVLTNTTTPRLTSDTWYYAAYARTTSSVDLSHRASIVRSAFDGRGAVPFPGGTSFRVWAPNASSVSVAGQFNGWSTTSAPLVAEPGGWWSVDLRNARAGHPYKFVLRNALQTLWRNDPYARMVTNSAGNSVIFDHRGFSWQTPFFQTPNWNEMVKLQVHIGTFNDLPGGPPGTFDSAIAKLDYVKEMGYNAIQLLPVQEFAGDFSWGYNPAHQFAVESAYGGPNGLKRFVDEANRRGIAVLTDLVHNHYGPTDLDLWRFDGWFQGPWGGIYFYQDGRARTPWGDTRPDFGRPEVRQFIRDNQAEWLHEYRLSGIRWDSTINIRNTDWGHNPDGWRLLQILNNDLDSSQPWKLNIAEDLQGDPWVTRPTSLGGLGFDAQWSTFVHPLRRALITPDDNQRNMDEVRAAILERFNGNALQRVIYTENHDENANGNMRVTSSIDPANPASYWSQKRSTLGAAITLTAPGIPMLFQGQDILEDGWFSDTRPVDWSKLNAHSGINRLYRDLIHLRRNLTGQTRGLTGPHVHVFHSNNANKVIAYHRWMNGGPNDDVVVVANFRHQ
ncbi:MAG: alpha-amylase family glycosyl hydrolase, partial [Fimbriimonadaceae bacterium]